MSDCKITCVLHVRLYDDPLIIDLQLEKITIFFLCQNQQETSLWSRINRSLITYKVIVLIFLLFISMDFVSGSVRFV